MRLQRPFVASPARNRRAADASTSLPRMAAQQHDKFVLKEKQRLQAKEKDLEKREAEIAQLRERSAAMETELKAKSAQLAQTAELLRKSREEASRSRPEQEEAAQQRDELAKQHAAASDHSEGLASQLEAQRQETVRTLPCFISRGEGVARSRLRDSP